MLLATELCLGLITSISGALFSTTQTEIIDGYPGKLSAFPGDSVSLYLNASRVETNYSLKLYDLKGDVVYRVPVSVFVQAPIGPKAYEEGYGYVKPSRIQIPKLKSGMYLWDNKIPFIIKDRNARIVVLYSSNTECAYNNGGGKSLYGFNSTGSTGATTVSFMRPAGLEVFGEAFLRWIASQNLQGLGYIADTDMDDYTEFEKAKLLIVTGHSEYWTLKARKNFDRFVSNGKDILVLSGNTMSWQVRYSPKKDQLICYRKSEADPVTSTKLKTINWSDESLGYPEVKSLGVSYFNAGYGNKEDKGWDGYKLVSDSPLLRNTGLKAGDTLRLLSRETDGAPVSGFEDGAPILNMASLGFYRAEIVGFDFVWRANTDGTMTWLVFKPTHTSGTVINVASTNWCAENGIGTNPKIRQVTLNMIDMLVKREEVFSPPSRKPFAAAAIE